MHNSESHCVGFRIFRDFNSILKVFGEKIEVLRGCLMYVFFDGIYMINMMGCVAWCTTEIWTTEILGA